jgi:hypothetical protein
MLTKHVRPLAVALTLSLVAAFVLATLLAVPATARADQEDEEHLSWRLWQEDYLTLGGDRYPWEAALTDGDGSHGTVKLFFYQDGTIRLSATVPDPETGRLVQAGSKTGRWQVEPHSRYTGILHVTLDGGQTDRLYLELDPNFRRMELSTFPLSDSDGRLIFLRRG